MTTDKIVGLLNDLSWNKPEELQHVAREKLMQLNESELYLLMQPNGKDCWENAALVLQEMGFPRVKPVIPQMLFWIADLNWPGAHTIMEILEGIDKDILLPHIQNSIKQAISENDDSRLNWLKLLCRHVEITEFNDLEID